MSLLKHNKRGFTEDFETGKYDFAIALCCYSFDTDKTMYKQNRKEKLMNILDFVAIVCVFTGLLCVGYFSSKKVKKADDFLIADHSLNKIQTAFSVAASDFGGSGLIGACALCYTVGLSGSWWNWCGAPAFLILGIFLVNKLRPLTITTIGDFLEMRYDKRTRLVASVMQLCATVPMLSAQFLVGAVALQTLFGIPRIWGLVISVVLVLSYTAFGGLMAVANTDVYNFCILVGSISIAVPIMLTKAGGITAVFEAVPSSFLQVGKLGVMEPLSWVCMSLFMYGTQQVYLQRVFAAKTVGTAKFAYVFTSGAYVVYGILVGIIGITMAVLMPGLADTNTVYVLMLKNYLPVGFAGIGLAGIFAASMSTADSTLLAGTTLFVNDIYKRYINKNASDQRILMLSRVTTMCICIGGIVVAQMMQNLIDIVYSAGLFYSAAVFFPIILGIYWKRGNERGALCGIIAALFTGLCIEYVFGGMLWGIPSNMLAALSSIVMFIAISLCTAPPNEKKLECLRER